MSAAALITTEYDRPAILSPEEELRQIEDKLAEPTRDELAARREALAAQIAEKEAQDETKKAELLAALNEAAPKCEEAVENYLNACVAIHNAGLDIEGWAREFSRLRREASRAGVDAKDMPYIRSLGQRGARDRDTLKLYQAAQRAVVLDPDFNS